MARKSKRRTLDWARILATLLVLNCVAGVIFSPATAVTKLRVEGVDTADAKRILAAAQLLKNVPCIRVTPELIEDRILSQPSIASATLSRNPFGRARLQLVYRRPIATTKGPEIRMLTADGCLVAWPRKLASLPLIELPPSANAAQTSIVGAWHMQAVANFCSKLASVNLPIQIRTIQVESTGQVSLFLAEGSRVIFGYPDGLVEKFGKLTAFLSDSSRNKGPFELNLVTPSRPVSRRL